MGHLYNMLRRYRFAIITILVCVCGRSIVMLNTDQLVKQSHFYNEMDVELALEIINDLFFPRSQLTEHLSMTETYHQIVDRAVSPRGFYLNWIGQAFTYTGRPNTEDTHYELIVPWVNVVDIVAFSNVSNSPRRRSPEYTVEVKFQVKDEYGNKLNQSFRLINLEKSDYKLSDVILALKVLTNEKHTQ